MSTSPVPHPNMSKKHKKTTKNDIYADTKPDLWREKLKVRPKSTVFFKTPTNRFLINKLSQKIKTLELLVKVQSVGLFLLTAALIILGIVVDQIASKVV